MSFEVYQFHLMLPKSETQLRAVEATLNEAAGRALKLASQGPKERYHTEATVLDWDRDMDTLDGSRIPCEWVKASRSYFLQLAIDPEKRKEMQQDLDDLVLLLGSLKGKAVAWEMLLDTDQLRQWASNGASVPPSTPAMRRHLCRHDEGRGCDPWEDLWEAEDIRHDIETHPTAD